MKVIPDALDKDRKMTPGRRWNLRERARIRKELFLTNEQIATSTDRVRLHRLLFYELRGGNPNDQLITTIRARLLDLRKPLEPWSDFIPRDITKHIPDKELHALIKKNLATLPKNI